MFLASGLALLTGLRGSRDMARVARLARARARPRDVLGRRAGDADTDLRRGPLGRDDRAARGRTSRRPELALSLVRRARGRAASAAAASAPRETIAAVILALAHLRRAGRVLPGGACDDARRRRLVGVLGAEGEGHLLRQLDRLELLHVPARAALPPLRPEPARDGFPLHGLGLRAGARHFSTGSSTSGSCSRPRSLLRRLVPAWLAWLFVGLTGVIPQLDGRLLGAQADWTLDLEFAIAALLAFCWLRSA